MVNVLTVRFAVLAAAISLFSPVHADVPLSPQKGGYSVVFPDQPTEQNLQMSPTVTMTVYTVNHPDAAFVSGFTDYSAGEFKDEEELQQSVDNFVRQLKAQVIERKRMLVRLTDGRRVQKVEFTFDGEQLAGRGMVLITNSHSTVMAAALAYKPNDKHDDVDKFLSSVKLTGQE